MLDKRALALPRQLIRRYRTRDPFMLADALDITVMFRANFLRQKGAFSIVAGRSFIFINANLSEELLDLASQCEYEANVVAAALLLDDDELIDHLQSGEDLQSIARSMAVHVDLLLLRLQTMQLPAGAPLPRIPSRKFLGSISDDAGRL